MGSKESKVIKREREKQGEWTMLREREWEHVLTTNRLGKMNGLFVGPIDNSFKNSFKF